MAFDELITLTKDKRVIVEAWIYDKHSPQPIADMGHPALLHFHDSGEAAVKVGSIIVTRENFGAFAVFENPPARIEKYID